MYQINLNVSQKDHENEERALALLKDMGWTIERHHTDLRSHPYDCEATYNSVPYILEIRTRERYSGAQLNNMGGVFINCDKFWCCVKIARNNGKKYGFVILASDGLWGAMLYNEDPHECHLGPVINPDREIKRGQDLNDSCFAYMVKLKKL